MTDNTPVNIAALTPLARLHESRLKRWHQNGEALLSFENLRSWLNAAGLVLFTPRPQIAAPGPSLVEAVLGTTTPGPTLEQTSDARTLLVRMVAEGIAVPLNLLGAPGGAAGDMPDFVASAAVFSYIFTLRGDKTWKQPPGTSGANKVSQLAGHTYEILEKSGAKTASDLASELGSGVTETAALRALSELWTHLRVLPLPQADGKATLWELASARYTKQIKAGANAGQPSALSALISLYLGQVAVATEDDIEVFLSPVASRSRVRDVIHALTAARQLDSVAIEGRTMVHLAGETPDFLAPADSGGKQELIEAATMDSDESEEEKPQDSEAAEAEPGERIKKFVAKPRKIGTGYLAKGAPLKGAAKPFGKDRPARGERPAFAKPERSGRGERPAFGRSDRPARGERPAFGRSDRPARPAFGGSERGARDARPEGRPERERRPFQKSRPEGAAGDAKPRFDRPWNEDRPKRPAGRDGERPARREGQRAPFTGTRSSTDRPRPARDAGKPGEGGGWKPAFREKSRTERPPFREGGSRPPRREGGFERRDERPARFAKDPNAPKRPFRRAEEGGSAGQGQGERPARPFRRFDERPGGKRPFVRRPEGGAEGRAPRPFRAPREGGEDRRGREGGGGGTARAGTEGRDRRPAKFASKFSGKRPGPRAEGGFSSRPRPAAGGSFSRPRPAGRTEGGFSPRPRPAGRAGDRPFGAGGPSGKRPAKRTFKRKDDESA